jgi:hypothetical protein
VTTTAVDPAHSAFAAALAKDAGRTVAPPPDIPPPPPVDPDAPHGRDGNGVPLTPFGSNKKTGAPNKKPPGPGRPKTAVTERPAAPAPPRAAGHPAAAEDFAGDLQNLADSVWLGGSALKGGKLGPIRIPDTRAYALAWHQASPNLVATWTAAAQQNPTVRGYVRKLSGEGSWSWIIGVAISAAGLASGLASVASATAEEKAQLVAVNDRLSQEYVREQMMALGMEVPDEAAA